MNFQVGRSPWRRSQRACTAWAGRDLAGRSVSLTGEDPDKLLQDACAWAAENADSPPTRPDQAK